MNNNELSRVEDLLADESFLRYCRGSKEDQLHWEKEAALNPELRDTIDRAKQLYGLIVAELTDPVSEVLGFRKLLEERKNAMDNTPEVPVYRMPSKRRVSVWVAASVAALIAVSGIWWYSNHHEKAEVAQADPGQRVKLVTDAAPGKNTATLILGDGTSVLLDSAGNGEIANQGHTRVIKLEDGQVQYKTAGDKTTDIFYNTMQTPRGGQYHLVLPDGTNVWLNAASSIRYPTAFTGSERKVSITGEVYFEVARVADPAGRERLQSFIVEKAGMQIEVLGTHFNVNTYDDETDMKTTLLEGSVRVTSSGGEQQGVKLQPGQQAALHNTGGFSVKKDVDVQGVMAWKNGLFDFSDADIKTIMRQVGRWYDLDISYEGDIPPRAFSGKITRNTNVSNVLRILEQSNIHFSIEGKKIIVKP